MVISLTVCAVLFQELELKGICASKDTLARLMQASDDRHLVGWIRFSSIDRSWLLRWQGFS
jgi:hypothetical protein